MKVAKLIAILLLIAAAGFSVPTLITAFFTGEPLNKDFVALSSSFLVLAIIFLGAGWNSNGGSGPSKPPPDDG